MSKMIQIEDTNYDNEKQGLNALAFCHYPVVVSVGDKTETFNSFDEAREWIEVQLKEN
ncbi:MAG: hypothetical protein IKA59_02520 [Clostridia bacterium]|nr:hypothetical protein [Clostridia bacterium]